MGIGVGLMLILYSWVSYNPFSKNKFSAPRFLFLSTAKLVSVAKKNLNNMENTPIQKPDNFLVWAILSTVMCCLPLGIVAILKASKVDTLWLAGQHDEAIATAAEAKKWTLIAVGCGVAWMAIYALIMIVAAVAGSL